MDAFLLRLESGQIVEVAEEWAGIIPRLFGTELRAESLMSVADWRALEDDLQDMRFDGAETRRSRALRQELEEEAVEDAPDFSIGRPVLLAAE